MKKYTEYEQLLQELEVTNPKAFEYIDEEINIVIHKLKFIPTESRPNVLLISDVRTLSQDFGSLTKEALDIAGGIWTDNLHIDQAQRIIFVQNPSALFSDLPILLQQEEFSHSPAYQSNEIYIIQNEQFGEPTHFLEDVEILAEISQSKYFIYGRQGTDWIKFDIG